MVNYSLNNCNYFHHFDFSFPPSVNYFLFTHTIEPAPRDLHGLQSDVGNAIGTQHDAFDISIFDMAIIAVKLILHFLI